MGKDSLQPQQNSMHRRQFTIEHDPPITSGRRSRTGVGLGPPLRTPHSSVRRPRQQRKRRRSRKAAGRHKQITARHARRADGRRSQRQRSSIQDSSPPPPPFAQATSQYEFPGGHQPALQIISILLTISIHQNDPCIIAAHFNGSAVLNRKIN